MRTDYYRDKMDAPWLHRALASFERNALWRAVFEQLVAVKDAPVEQWRGLFRAQGSDLATHAPSTQPRALALVGIGAAAQKATLAWSFSVGEYAAYTSVWTRIALVLLIGPAMVVGAAV